MLSISVGRERTNNGMKFDSVEGKRDDEKDEKIAGSLDFFG